MAQDTQVRSMGGVGIGDLKRPGWITFAAVVTFVVAFFYGLLALSEFADSYWFYNNLPDHLYNLAGAHLFWWGIFDTIITVVAVAAAVSLLRGGFFGMMMGMIGAGFSLLRWLFYIPATPWLAITIITIDVLIIYGLAASIDYFAETADAG